MPQPASSLERDLYLHVLLLAFSKMGKSYSTISSCARAFGPGYVIACGDRSGMTRVAQVTKKFTYDLVRDENDMEAGIKEARRGVKEGQYKWILVDDFSLYASWLHDELKDASAAQSKSGEANGRVYYPELKQRLLNIVRRVLDIKAHIIFASHWVSPSPEMDGQRAKSGQGILPMIPGSAREELPALFPDVIFMEREEKTNRRVFRINPEGVWGPGCKDLDTHTIEPDFGAFMQLHKDADKVVGGSNDKGGRK
jgi:hypothetical protein